MGTSHEGRSNGRERMIADTDNSQAVPLESKVVRVCT
jgi:hypothetical protein